MILERNLEASLVFGSRCYQKINRSRATGFVSWGDETSVPGRNHGRRAMLKVSRYPCGPRNAIARKIDLPFIFGAPDRAQASYQ